MGAAPRIGWEEYFLRLASVTALRSPCLSRQVGCVLVSANRVIAAGYNGPPAGMPHCPVCRRKEAGAGKGFERCPAIHAELNAVISCAASGARVSAAALYSTLTPCAGCAKMILNLDVRRVCCLEVYPDPYARELLEAAGRIFFPTDGGLAFEWHKSE